MSKQDGGPAFPTEEFVGGNYDMRYHTGLSLRDYFAAAALPEVLRAYFAANGNGCAADHALRNAPALAFKYADAMLAERSK